MAENIQKIENITSSKTENNTNFTNKQIKDCNDHSLFDFITSQNLIVLFLDLQEVRRFVLYLYENKGETIVGDLIKNFKSIVDEFEQNFYYKNQ